MVTEVRLVQSSKADIPIVFTLLPIVTEISELQPSKAISGIEVTLSGMVIEVRPVHPLNTHGDIVVTCSGIVIEVRPTQPSNAPHPINVTLLGMVTEVRPVQPLKSTEIKKIEVLTNPGSKYGVNITSVILITTSVPNKNAWGIDVMERIGMKGGLQNTFNTTAYVDLPKFSFKIGTTHKNIENKFHKEELYDYWVANNHILNRSIGDQNNVRNNLNLLMDIVYRFSEKQSLNLYGSVYPIMRSQEDLHGLLSHKMNGDDSVIQGYSSNTFTNAYNTLLSGIYHFATSKNKLDISSMYFHTSFNTTRNLTTDDQSNFFSQKSHANNINLKTDFEQKVSEYVKFSSGLEYVFTHRYGSYESQSSSNDLFNQHQATGYVGLQCNLNDRWTFHTELGLEFIDYKYYLNEVLVEDQSKSSVQILPILSMSYQYDDFSLEASYRKTVDKPNYEQLSANNFMTNKYLRWDGNPTLRNSYVHTSEIDISYDWASLSLSYARVLNGVFEVNSLLNFNDFIVKTSPQKLPDYNQFYLGLSLNPQIKKLGIVADVGMQLQDLKYAGVLYNKPLVEYVLRLNYNLPKGFSLRCGIAGHLKNGSYATGVTNGYSNVDIRLSKSWMNGKLTTQIYATDIFNNAYERISLSTNNILRQDYSHGGMRGLFFTIQYRLGKNIKSRSHNLSKEMMRLLPK